MKQIAEPDRVKPLTWPEYSALQAVAGEPDAAHGRLARTKQRSAVLTSERLTGIASDVSHILVDQISLAENSPRAII